MQNVERSTRFANAMTLLRSQYEDDTYTNLVDFLADGLHWCRLNGQSFPDALDMAVNHFEAEIKDISTAVPNEIISLVPHSTADHPKAREQVLESVVDQALGAFWDVVVQRYPQAETGDLSPWATITLQTSAEKAIAEWIDNNVTATTMTGE